MKCPQCKTDFEPEYIKNEYGRRYLLSKFCSPFCKEEWEEKRRALRTAEHVQTKVTFPKWVCQECRFSLQLDFEPMKDVERFLQLVCPKCTPQKVV